MDELDETTVRAMLQQWAASRADSPGEQRLNASLASGSYLSSRPRGSVIVASIAAVVVLAAVAGFVLAPKFLNPKGANGLASSPATSSSASPTTAQSPVPSSSPASSPTPTVAPAPVCTGTQLAADLTTTGGAAGHFSAQFTLHNGSTSACTVNGYPTVALLGGQGQSLTTHQNDGPGYIVQPEAPALVTLAPGSDASFVVGTVEYTAGEACPAASALAITPPGMTRTYTIQVAVLSSDPCGAIDVSPMYSGAGPQP